ncbi:SMI1/KNR4 family protein [Amycolatopsis sp. NPDC052450]|uniref:SMI1/KNR4 family protein n=1 Tax=Amycolatopsis sp. NPDC052450 TaxID=3363937 RepID=UPI0037C6D54D
MSHSEISSRVDEIAVLLGWQRQFTVEKSWEIVEQNLGIALPADYKELLARFPGGVFRRIEIDSPVANEKAWTKYKRALEEILQILGDEDLEYLDQVDYTLYPEFGGLLPWGSDGQGGTFCWITDSSDPDLWRIAYHDQGADQWREHAGPITQLLYEILTNTGQDNLLRWDFTDLPVEYIPFSNR